MVVAYVAPKDSLGVAVVPHDHMVEAVPAEGACNSLGKGIRAGRPRGCNKLAHTEPLNARREGLAVNGVAIANEESRCLASIADGFDDPLRGPGRARVGSH